MHSINSEGLGRILSINYIVICTILMLGQGLKSSSRSNGSWWLHPSITYRFISNLPLLKASGIRAAQEIPGLLECGYSSMLAGTQLLSNTSTCISC